MGFNFSLLEYSIDMVRLQSEIKRSDFQEIFELFIADPNVTYREMNSISSYRHNFYIKDLIQNDDSIYKTFLHHNYLETFRIDKLDQCSFWVGVDHNSRFEKSKYVDIVLEYNPNKCSRSLVLDYILRRCFSSNPTSVVKKIDFAIDLPMDILDVHLVRDYRANYRVFDNGGSDKTYYMRKRGSDGALKIYNKRIESKLDVDKTRYEVTLHINNALRYMSTYSVNKCLFPDLRLTTNVQVGFDSQIKVTGTDKVLLLACMEHPEYLKDLSRKKREKIEEILHSLDTVVSFKEVNIIDETVRSYFETINDL